MSAFAVRLAIFVKTPGASPVKTRLGADVGPAAAERLYRLSVRAVESAAREAARRDPRLTPVWAVAEAGELANPLWAGFAAVPQGEGGLGPRLDRVYASQLAPGGGVLLAGGDSPHLAPETYLAAAARLAADPARFVALPTADGGFSIFGGARPVPRAAWLGVPYSAADTLARLEAALAPLAPVARMPASFDVDTRADLAPLAAALAGLAAPTPEQRALAAWLRSELGVG